ncbi:MAG TPA: UDP-N-acetylmuramate dehydrogenase [Polyangia bacterium]|nr:UDP-N-acetylmuramate dehydrogenase [Polyangia bacterium]
MIRDRVPLAPLTTLEVGGDARHFTEATDEAAVGAALRWAAARDLPVAILGGGSNVVVADAGFDGLVIRVAPRGLRFDAAADGTMLLTAAAGEPWDALVAETVARGLGGLECLSGIPGLAGATPIQNVGAYGQEVADTIRSVRVLDRATLQVREMDAADCGFGYRDSRFKREPHAFVVLAVTFVLRPGAPPALRYPELAAALAGATAPTLAEARAAVLTLRARKSMVIRAGDPNRRSAGSFFTNPVVEASVADEVARRAGTAGAGMPRFPAGPGRNKLSAGWLIEQAGFAKGLRRGAVGISTAHALALVNLGGARAADLLALAAEIVSGVRDRLGITLVPEPVLLGAWPPAAPQS